MKLSHLEPLKLIVEDAGEGWTKETATVCLLHSSSYEQVNVVHMLCEGVSVNQNQSDSFRM